MTYGYTTSSKYVQIDKPEHHQSTPKTYSFNMGMLLVAVGAVCGTFFATYKVN